MKLGFCTPIMRGRSIEDVLKFAKENKFEALEVAAKPGKADHLEVATLNKEKAESFKELFNKYGIELSSLGYYDNNLSSDLKQRKEINDHLKKVVDAAEMLGCSLVGTFTGKDVNLKEEQNYEELGKVFSGLLKYAEDKGVKLMIENCPHMGGMPENMPKSLGMSPEQWDKMFRVLPNKNFGLNYDPSHLFWLGIDYIKPLYQFKDRIFHVHAKDTEVFEDKLKHSGIFGKGWHRARIPGLGDIYWRKFISTLQEIGDDGVVSIEHEDPVWHAGEKKIERGLQIGAKFLLPLIK